MARASSKMLSTSGERGHPAAVPDPMENFLSLTIEYSSQGFILDGLYQFEGDFSIPGLLTVFSCVC